MIRAIRRNVLLKIFFLSISAAQPAPKKIKRSSDKCSLLDACFDRLSSHITKHTSLPLLIEKDSTTSIINTMLTDSLGAYTGFFKDINLELVNIKVETSVCFDSVDCSGFLAEVFKSNRGHLASAIICIDEVVGTLSSAYDNLVLSETCSPEVEPARLQETVNPEGKAIENSMPIRDLIKVSVDLLDSLIYIFQFASSDLVNLSGEQEGLHYKKLSVIDNLYELIRKLGTVQNLKQQHLSNRTLPLSKHGESTIGESGASILASVESSKWYLGLKSLSPFAQSVDDQEWLLNVNPSEGTLTLDGKVVCKNEIRASLRHLIVLSSLRMLANWVEHANGIPNDLASLMEELSTSRCTMTSPQKSMIVDEGERNAETRCVNDINRYISNFKTHIHMKIDRKWLLIECSFTKRHSNVYVTGITFNKSMDRQIIRFVLAVLDFIANGIMKRGIHDRRTAETVHLLALFIRGMHVTINMLAERDATNTIPNRVYEAIKGLMVVILSKPNYNQEIISIIPTLCGLAFIPSENLVQANAGSRPHRKFWDEMWNEVVYVCFKVKEGFVGMSNFKSKVLELLKSIELYAVLNDLDDMAIGELKKELRTNPYDSKVTQYMKRIFQYFLKVGATSPRARKEAKMAFGSAIDHASNLKANLSVMIENFRTLVTTLENLHENNGEIFKRLMS